MGNDACTVPENGAADPCDSGNTCTANSTGSGATCVSDTLAHGDKLAAGKDCTAPKKDEANPCVDGHTCKKASDAATKTTCVKNPPPKKAGGLAQTHGIATNDACTVPENGAA